MAATDRHARSDPTDATLDELRARAGAEIAVAAMFDGWTDAALVAAAEMAGVDPGGRPARPSRAARWT